MLDRPNNPRMLSIREKLARLAPRRAIEILGPETLRTSRLILRPLMGKDRAQFVQAIATSRPELEPYYDLWQPGDSDDQVFDRQIELTRLGAATGLACRRGAFLEDGRFVAYPGTEWCGSSCAESVVDSPFGQSITVRNGARSTKR